MNNEEIKQCQDEIIEHFKSIGSDEENVIEPLRRLFDKLSETDVSYNILYSNGTEVIAIIKVGFMILFDHDIDGFENAMNIIIQTSNAIKFRINTKSIKRIEVGKYDFSFITSHTFDDGDSAVNRVTIPLLVEGVLPLTLQYQPICSEVLEKS